ncbi:putative leucine-rich repeat receptor-like protein kinase [Forsythia ovata]|uniref:Leucine-rich repeat receptor-like protein kinase n=1 Tax=Forsythia ovata TaxID=205694 RepID=A0ABD1PYE2_9LAMI
MIGGNDSLPGSIFRKEKRESGDKSGTAMRTELEGNRFSGSISGLSLPSLQDFNVSGNALAGEIPNSLSGFPASAFEKNSVLCGVPLEKCKLVSSDPTRPGAMASPLSPRNTLRPAQSRWKLSHW